MRCMYPDFLVYANNEAVHQVLPYIGKKETEEERERLKFSQDVFLPINYEMVIF